MTDAPLLVTGAAGFIGARFVESAVRAGRAVVSVDAERHFRERPEHTGVRFGEIVDRDRLFERIDAGLELGGIVHLGACTDTTELDEAYLQRVNVQYSQRLWAIARERGVPFVYASSAATYGGGEHGFDDDETTMPRLAPLNPYGWSKQRFDLWALAEERAGRAPAAWSGFKFFNVYGFGERHKERMSSVVLQAFDRIRTTGRARLFMSHRDGVAHGHQARDFVFVGDVVDVLWFALRTPLRRGIYNLGTGRARTFLDLAHATFAALAMPVDIEFVPTPEHLRARYQYFTEARMERLRAAGYTAPFTSLEDGVRRYVGALVAAETAARS
ncbi:MAG: ADP-glyceromanno-heptose 6-epimerase [Planctomycetes bacterium]|nr:ADP-glyceromanno-heptose 6-epimerase [Planctomycetota bacterium]